MNRDELAAVLLANQANPSVEDRPDSSFSKPKKIERPDGSNPIMFGWICLFVGIASVCWSFAIDVTPYGYSIDNDAVATRVLCQTVGSALCSLGALLWSIGYVVRAISFLPAKSDHAPNQ